VNSYGSGRVFGTTLGHANGTVGHPVYLDLVTRGLLWVCGRLDGDSAPHITAVRQVTNSTRVAWESVPGWRYAIESAPAVIGPWGLALAGTVTATNVISTATISTLGAPQRFLRVQRVEP
jgi:hypothetical protein